MSLKYQIDFVWGCRKFQFCTKNGESERTKIKSKLEKRPKKISLKRGTFTLSLSIFSDKETMEYFLKHSCTWEYWGRVKSK